MIIPCYRCKECGVKISLASDGTWMDGVGDDQCYAMLPTLRREREAQGHIVVHHPP